MSSSTECTRPQHIGIVACSAEGAALCYRTICTLGPQALGAYAHPEILLHSQSLAHYVASIERDDWAAVGELMLASARTLADAGAELLICPDNTIHRALPLIADRLPLPWLSIADAVADEAAARGFAAVGVLGTRWLVHGDVYPSAFAARGIRCVVPNGDECEAVHRIIMDDLVAGNLTQQATAAIVGVIARLRDDGCDAVALACTEIPLIAGDANAPLPTLDSTRLLARAALRASCRARASPRCDPRLGTP